MQTKSTLHIFSLQWIPEIARRHYHSMGKSTSGTVGTIIGGFVGGALAAWEIGLLWN
ncbi:MAG: hypothetical protein ACRCXJ_20640 [Enterobacter asburiae]